MRLGGNGVLSIYSVRFSMICRGGCGGNRKERRVMGAEVVSEDFSVFFFLSLNEWGWF